MKIEKDAKGNKLPLVVPTKEEFDAWVAEKEFTTLEELLKGYAIIDGAHQRATKELTDPEMHVALAIVSALDEIEKDIYNLIVCAFRDFAEEKGGAK